ncbi:hypothetical protein D1007_02833 [Hordeum vulgare]|nr:hypothetical protein D1007_02833 [Hordeum vulgare]
MRTEDLGRALGHWMGEAVRVDVDKDGLAKGTQLRVRATISVFEPLVRGCFLKSSPDDKDRTWYDFSYERIPHFCFECVRLVHEKGTCVPPIDSTQQWGGWLRTSSGKQSSAKDGNIGGGGGSLSLGSSRTGDSDRSRKDHAREKDIPIKRNLQADFAQSASSRTGVERGTKKGPKGYTHSSAGRDGSARDRDMREEIEQRRERERERERELRNKLKENQVSGGDRGDHMMKTRPEGNHMEQAPGDNPSRQVGVDTGSRHAEANYRKRGHYVRKPRPENVQTLRYEPRSRVGDMSKKRRPKQLWVAKEDPDRQIVHDSFIRDTRRRTSSIIQRISEDKEEIHHSMEQDVALNDASRDPTSSSIVTHFCLMAKASKVSPTLNPNISHDDDIDDNVDENNDEESDNIASLKIKGEMIFKSLYKNKLACSNFLEIMSIATEGKKYIEELEAHLEEHEATIETMEGGMFALQVSFACVLWVKMILDIFAIYQ